MTRTSHRRRSGRDRRSNPSARRPRRYSRGRGAGTEGDRFRLFTIMRLHARSQEVERLYSSDPPPIRSAAASRKQGTPWGEQVLDRGEILSPIRPTRSRRLRRPRADLQPRHRRDRTVPIRFQGRSLGTMNICSRPAGSAIRPPRRGGCSRPWRRCCKVLFTAYSRFAGRSLLPCGLGLLSGLLPQQRPRRLFSCCVGRGTTDGFSFLCLVHAPRGRSDRSSSSGFGSINEPLAWRRRS